MTDGHKYTFSGFSGPYFDKKEDKDCPPDTVFLLTPNNIIMYNPEAFNTECEGQLELPFEDEA